MTDLTNAQSRPERRDAAENRERILTTALRLFQRNSVEQVSMTQIAIESQVGPGTLYRRYRNKSELCLDLIKDSVELLFEDIEICLNEHSAASPSHRLKEVIKLFIGFRERKLQLLAGVEEGVTNGRPQSPIQSPIFNDLHEILVRLFKEMSAAAHTEYNSVFKADMLLMALKSDSYVFQRDVRGYSPELLVEQIRLTFFPEE